MEALESEWEEWVRMFSSRPEAVQALEIGCGTGILSTYMYTILSRIPWCKSLDAEGSSPSSQPSYRAHVTAVDINPAAVRIASETFRRNSVHGRVVESDLTCNVKDTLRHKVDVIIFNHPYVPCEAEELANADMHARSYCGGPKGRDILDRFVESEMKDLLTPQGVFYVVLLHPGNEIEEFDAKMVELGFYPGELLVARQEGIECLGIAKYRKRHVSEDASSTSSPSSLPSSSSSSSSSSSVPSTPLRIPVRKAAFESLARKLKGSHALSTSTGYKADITPASKDDSTAVTTSSSSSEYSSSSAVSAASTTSPPSSASIATSQSSSTLAATPSNNAIDPRGDHDEDDDDDDGDVDVRTGVNLLF